MLIDLSQKDFLLLLFYFESLINFDLQEKILSYVMAFYNKHSLTQ